MNSMNCDRAAELLFTGVVASSEYEQTQFESHVADCSRCRELQQQLNSDSIDMSAAVLQRTVGGACERAESLLFGEPDRDEAELLSRHLEHCADCSRLAAVDRRARELLPQLAVLDPGELFTARVLARTRAESAVQRRVRQWLEHPIEIAYGIAVACALLMAIPGAPLDGAPAQMLEWLRNGEDGNARGAGWVKATVIPLAMLPAEAVEEGGRIGTTIELEAAERATGVSWALDGLGDHVSEMGGALTERSWDELRPLWGNMRCDVRLVWRGIRGRLQTDDDRSC